jgi:hypothetical protein
MALQIGIVGLPNVGKSTLFKTLTKQAVPAENYPFTTIEPNVGVVAVTDPRLEKLAAVAKSEKIVPVVIRFVDIAGLVKGAHKGEGLGNKFLSNIRDVDAIVHIVRAFASKDVIHVHGDVDPERDYDIITTELILADLTAVELRIAGLEGKARSGDKHATGELAVLKKTQSGLAQGAPIRLLKLSAEELVILAPLQLLTQKPELVVWNIDETTALKIPTNVLPISAKIESELVDLPEKEAQEYLKSMGMQEPGLSRLIHASFKLIDLISFFAIGPKEAHAWPVKRGSTIKEAAGKIHTDFEKGFIRAEIISWEDYLACGSEVDAKTKGKMHLEGKEYLVRDGDIVFIHANP